MNKPKMISRSEAVAIFSDHKRVNGGTFVAIDTCTIPTLKGGKANPMQGNVRKFNEGSQVMVFQNKNGSSYESAVKRRMAAEGIDPDTFQLSPRSWGERVPNTPIIQHKGNQYLEVIFQRSGQVSYKLEGKDIQKSDIQGLEDKEESTQGGQEKKVIIRTFSFESIIAFRLNKESYIIAD